MTEFCASAVETASMLLKLIDDIAAQKPQPFFSNDFQNPVPPLPASARLLTRFGPRSGRTDGPQLFHTGLDFKALRGAPVFAVRAGTVTRVVRDEQNIEGFIGYGNVVVIHHADEDIWTFYAHLDELLTVPEMRVVAGQTIGRVGNSTNCRAPLMPPRLHFEIRVRAQDGSSPFPGPYRVNSRDPEVWLKSRGITYDPQGRLIIAENIGDTSTDSEEMALAAWEESDSEMLTPRPADILHLPWIPEQ